MDVKHSIAVHIVCIEDDVPDAGEEGLQDLLGGGLVQETVVGHGGQRSQVRTSAGVNQLQVEEGRARQPSLADTSQQSRSKLGRK